MGCFNLWIGWLICWWDVLGVERRGSIYFHHYFPFNPKPSSTTILPLWDEIFTNFTWNCQELFISNLTTKTNIPQDESNRIDLEMLAENLFPENESKEFFIFSALQSSIGKLFCGFTVKFREGQAWRKQKLSHPQAFRLIVIFLGEQRKDQLWDAIIWSHLQL